MSGETDNETWSLIEQRNNLFQEVQQLRADNARLKSEVEALKDPHNDQIWHLTQERDSAYGTVSMWLEANGPGGWIDKLQSDLQAHKDALRLALTAMYDLEDCAYWNHTSIRPPTIGEARTTINELLKNYDP